MNIMNIILEVVNIPKYFPLRFLFSFAIYLKLIRLAMAHVSGLLDFDVEVNVPGKF